MKWVEKHRVRGLEKRAGSIKVRLLRGQQLAADREASMPSTSIGRCLRQGCVIPYHLVNSALSIVTGHVL